jgi:predicted nucleic acid-binding protein
VDRLPGLFSIGFRDRIDLLIAGQALRRNATLVTANTKEFRRVKGLAWEDWAKSKV